MKVHFTQDLDAAYRQLHPSVGTEYLIFELPTEETALRALFKPDTNVPPEEYESLIRKNRYALVAVDPHSREIALFKQTYGLRTLRVI